VIDLVLKADREYRPRISIRNAFSEQDFNTRWLDLERTERDESLEHEWARIEDLTLPAVRAVLAGDRSSDAFRSVLDVMALHLSRSQAHQVLFSRIGADLMATYPQTIARDVEAQRRFEASRGRPPTHGELEALVREIWDLGVRTNQFRVERLAATYERVRGHLGQYTLQVCHSLSRQIGFIVGDVPVTLFRRGHVGAGIHQRLPIDLAEQIFMPLSPWLGVAVAPEPMDEVLLSPIDVVRVNRLSWQASVNVIGCHPCLEWQRCLSF
jgi:hypothetical protein